MVEKLMSAQELAEYLGVNEITVYKHVKAGKIPAIRVGKLWRFEFKKIQQLLAEGKLFTEEEEYQKNSIL